MLCDCRDTAHKIPGESQKRTADAMAPKGAFSLALPGGRFQELVLPLRPTGLGPSCLRVTDTRYPLR